MYLLDWEPLLIQTVPGVQLGVTVDGAKYLLEVVEDEDATVVVVGLLEELWSHNVDVQSLPSVASACKSLNLSKSQNLLICLFGFDQCFR